VVILIFYFFIFILIFDFCFVFFFFPFTRAHQSPPTHHNTVGVTIAERVESAGFRCRAEEDLHVWHAARALDDARRLHDPEGRCDRQLDPVAAVSPAATNVVRAYLTARMRLMGDWRGAAAATKSRDSGLPDPQAASGDTAGSSRPPLSSPSRSLPSRTSSQSPGQRISSKSASSPLGTPDPLVISGAPGAGLTVAAAHAALVAARIAESTAEVDAPVPASSVIVVRFAKISLESRGLWRMIHGICSEIVRRVHVALGEVRLVCFWFWFVFD
jgi:hypothetical protein